MKFLSVMPNLYVADVEASAAFYRDLLGGTETFRAPASGAAAHVEIRVGDVLIAVSSRDEVAPQGLPSPSGGHPFELVAWCDSADEAIAGLRAAGVPVVVEPAAHASGHRRGYVADPDGNWVAVVSAGTAASASQPGAGDHGGVRRGSSRRPRRAALASPGLPDRRLLMASAARGTCKPSPGVTTGAGGGG